MAPAAVAAPNPKVLERVVAAAEASTAENLAATLLDGLLVAGAGVLPEDCAGTLRKGRGAPDMNERAMAYAGALRDTCPPTCASAVFASLAEYPASEQLSRLIAGCDAKGPDPVFGAPELRGQRIHMDGMDYLLTRMVLDPVFAATSGTALGARYEALRPTLAAAMSRHPTATFGAPVVSGGLRLVDAQAQLTGSQFAFDACYAEARRLDPAVAGQVKVVALVDAVGRTLANVDGNVPLDLLACLEHTVAERLVFEAPPGADLGRVEVTLTFRAE